MASDSDKARMAGEDLRSYGRRRGRVRSRRQQELWERLLPRVALQGGTTELADPAGLFTPPVRDVWIEIGFGGGEHLLWQATRHPEIGLIGCEPFEDGVVKVLAALEPGTISNVRIWAHDARPLLRRLPTRSLGKAFILFPDPWPKRRHHKRRLIGRQTLDELARTMRPGSQLRIATDIGSYASIILLSIAEHGGFRWVVEGPRHWRERSADWPPTRYENKALAAGRKCYYLRFERSD